MHKKRRNWWKISFISLVSILVLIFVIIGFKILKPVQPMTETKSVINSDDSVFEVSLSRKQANNLSAKYINSFLNSDDIKYQFTVNKNNANIHGNVKFLGSKIGFDLIMIPKMKENGDIVLTAKSLKIGSLPVPISFVMNYIGNSYHLPDWVSLSSKDKTIDLQLTRFKTKSGYSIKAKKIDLKNNIIKMEVFKK